MGIIKDETGNRYGRLTVISMSDVIKSRHRYWNCLCDCGNTTLVSGSNLRTGKVISCGCAHQLAKVEDLTGQQFGWLTVKELDTNSNDERIRWICECKCGTILSVRANRLKLGSTIDCGCRYIVSHGEEKIKKILNENNIPFIQHKYININDKRFFFDFYVNDTYFIEYDGSQHFKISDTQGGWNTEDNLKKTQESDFIKNEYCFINNIPLIRIPYTRFNKLNINDLQLETTDYLLKEKSE